MDKPEPDKPGSPGLHIALPFSTLDKTLSRRPIQYKEAPQTIGEHLVKVRIDRNLSKKAVAEQIGVSPATITVWEKNKSEPEVRQMKNVIAFLGYYPFPEPETIAGRIKKYRHVHGLTLEEFGKLLSVDGATIWTWENEKCVPNKATMQRIDELINLVIECCIYHLW